MKFHHQKFGSLDIKDISDFVGLKKSKFSRKRPDNSLWGEKELVILQHGPVSSLVAGSIPAPLAPTQPRGRCARPTPLRSWALLGREQAADAQAAPLRV